jgi:hypothetical protein
LLNLVSVLGIACLLGCQPTPADKTTAGNEKPSQKAGNSQADAAKRTSKLESLSKSDSPIRFATHGKDIGVDFQYQNGESAWLVAMIESNGGGIGLIDFDRDGRWDFFVPGGGRLTDRKEPIMVTNGLFHQRANEMKFDNRAELSNTAPGVCYSFGANVGDFDADGFSDIFVTGYAGQQLLRNMGDGTFEDVTGVAGFHHRGWSSSSAWSDIDRDGDLDLYVAHYGVWSPELEKQCFNGSGEIDRCAPADFVGEPDELWLNQGDGTFSDVSERIKVGPYRGIGVVACDWDADGNTDFYVTNDEDPNTMFSNKGNGEFDEIGARSGTFIGSRNIVDGSMGIGVGDFDGNLRPDILVTNYQAEYCELYSNQGKQYFSLNTRAAGLMALGQSIVGWGTAFFDADHDMDEDLIIVAGHTSRKPISSNNLQRPYLLENVNKKRLVSLGEKPGEFFADVHAGRGLAIGDLDNDGDIDSVISMLEQPVAVLENKTKSEFHYLLVDLVGTRTNRDAIGAIVECETDDGKQIRHRFSGGSYASTHASTLHFGLGKSTSVKQISIQWPSGAKQILSNVAANQRLTVIESPSE